MTDAVADIPSTLESCLTNLDSLKLLEKTLKYRSNKQISEVEHNHLFFLWSPERDLGSDILQP